MKRRPEILGILELNFLLPHLVQPDDPWAALEGRLGRRLMVISKKDGKAIAGHELPASPVTDGIAAAHGKLFMCLKNGELICGGSVLRGGIDLGGRPRERSVASRPRSRTVCSTHGPLPKGFPRSVHQREASFPSRHVGVSPHEARNRNRNGLRVCSFLDRSMTTSSLRRSSPSTPRIPRARSEKVTKSCRTQRSHRTLPSLLHILYLSLYRSRNAAHDFASRSDLFLNT